MKIVQPVAPKVIENKMTELPDRELPLVFVDRLDEAVLARLAAGG